MPEMTTLGLVQSPISPEAKSARYRKIEFERWRGAVPVPAARVFLFGITQVFWGWPGFRHASLFKRPKKGGFNKSVLM